MLLLRGHSGRVRGLCYAPDGTRLASCGADRAVRVWDLASGSERLTLQGHGKVALGVVFSPDGRRLASVGRGEFPQVWDAATGTLLEWVDVVPVGDDMGESLWSRAFLGGRRSSESTVADLRAALAAGWRLARARPHRVVRIVASPPPPAAPAPIAPGARKRGQVIEMTAGVQTLSVYVPASTGGVLRGSFVPGCGFSLGSGRDMEAVLSPDDRVMALTADRYVQLWDLQRRRLTLLEGHRKPVWSLAFAPDGRTLATGGHDETVRLWDVASGDERHCWHGRVGKIDAVAFSPDGMTVAAGGPRGIVVWDVDEE